LLLLNLLQVISNWDVSVRDFQENRAYVMKYVLFLTPLGWTLKVK
jgi:hypothetical protein